RDKQTTRRRAEQAQPAGRCDLIYRADGDIEGGLDEMERRGGCQYRDRNREPNPERAGRTDRILYQHAGYENRHRRESESQRVDQARARGGARSLWSSGSAVREAGGRDQSGSRPESKPVISGHDGAAEHRETGGSLGAERSQAEGNGGRDRSCQIRPDLDIDG